MAPRHQTAPFRFADLDGYHEICTIVSDPGAFSSRILEGVPGTEEVGHMALEDPPHYTKLLNLDRINETGQMDVISDFGIPLPVTVIAELRLLLAGSGSPTPAPAAAGTATA